MKGELALASIAARRAAVEKFRLLAREDPRVITAFLGGSLAAETADRYSDIDVYYVVKASEYDGFHAGVPSLLEKVGVPVFFEEHSNFGFDLVLFMFRNGVKGELGLGTVDKLKVMHVGPVKVLVDKEKLLEGVSFPYQKDPEGEELRRFVEKQLKWYWYWYNVMLTATARGHLWSAISSLDSMRGHLFSLLKASHHLPRYAKSWSLPTRLLREMGKSIPSYTPASIRRCAASMTRVLKRETRELLASTGAEYPLLFEKTILERFD